MKLSSVMSPAKHREGEGNAFNAPNSTGDTLLRLGVTQPILHQLWKADIYSTGIRDHHVRVSIIRLGAQTHALSHMRVDKGIASANMSRHVPNFMDSTSMRGYHVALVRVTYPRY